jgi:hypothetical protein
MSLHLLDLRKAIGAGIILTRHGQIVATRCELRAATRCGAPLCQPHLNVATQHWEQWGAGGTSARGGAVCSGVQVMRMPLAGVGRAHLALRVESGGGWSRVLARRPLVPHFDRYCRTVAGEPPVLLSVCDRVGVRVLPRVVLVSGVHVLP